MCDIIAVSFLNGPAQRGIIWQPVWRLVLCPFVLYAVVLFARTRYTVFSGARRTAVSHRTVEKKYKFNKQKNHFFYVLKFYHETRRRISGRNDGPRSGRPPEPSAGVVTPSRSVLFFITRTRQRLLFARENRFCSTELSNPRTKTIFRRVSGIGKIPGCGWFPAVQPGPSPRRYFLPTPRPSERNFLFGTATVVIKHMAFLVLLTYR